MGYMNEFEAELRKKLNGQEGEDAVVKWICETVLQSYKNGITDGKKGAMVKRQGESRRRGFFGKTA